MKLPNHEDAVVDIEKIRGYCLSKTHQRGRHKARVFESALGLRARDAESVRDALLEAARAQDAHPGAEDEYGRRYTVEFTMKGPAGTARVRSHWIVKAHEGFPRFVTCYVT